MRSSMRLMVCVSKMKPASSPCFIA
jgi:hypothetical protein